MPQHSSNNKFLQWIVVNKTSIISCVAIILSIAYIWLGYEEEIRQWYDEKVVLPYMSHIVHNAASVLIAVFAIIMVVVDLVYKCKKIYLFNSTTIILFGCLNAVLLYYRFGTSDYIYLPYNWNIKYVDIIWVVTFTYLLAAIILYIVHWVQIRELKKNNEERIKESLLPDWAIDDGTADMLGLNEDIDVLSETIGHLDYSKTWNIAITAQWGGGKTSYLNLLKEKLYDEGYDIMIFNPRHSTSPNLIQYDFLLQLSSHLSNYKFGISLTIRKYISALQLVTAGGWLDKLLNGILIWNDRNKMKQRIETTFKGLTKPIIVIVDDFDRLEKEEIIEVLKLIDGNAAFPNLVTLTAYDKQHMEQLFDIYNPNGNTDECFTDKFFNVEIPVPKKPYGKYRAILLEQIQRVAPKIRDPKDEGSVLPYLIKYLPTLRDFKRFANILQIDSKYVKNDVRYGDYLLITLIKYKFPEEYNKLYLQVYLRQGGPLFEGYNYYKLKKSVENDNIKSLEILRQLFHFEDIKEETVPLRSVRCVDSFANYFVNRPLNYLPLSQLNDLFDPWLDYRLVIDTWIKDKNKLAEFVEYFDSFYIGDMTNPIEFHRYIEMLVYASTLAPDTRLFLKFYHFTYIENVEKYKDKLLIEIDDYRNQILQTICDTVVDPTLRLLRNIHIDYKTKREDENNYLIKDADIWLPIKSQFKNILSETDGLGNVREYFQSCIYKMEEPSRKIIIDTECCQWYREYLYSHPNEFIKTFVRLGGTSSADDYNSVVCEPFSLQIFGDDKGVWKFINYCVQAQIEGSICAQNSWPIYRANGYEPIDFHNQGSVPAKIDNNMQHEREQLEELQKINKRINRLQSDIINTRTRKELVNKRLEVLQSRVDKIDLFIKLREQIIHDLQEIKKQNI